jgi:hypothetical protein
VNLDDLDASRTSMFNLVSNSKGRIQQRTEKKMMLQREHQLMQEQADMEERDLTRQWEAERQKLQAGKPKGLLGAGRQKTDHSQFQFEDDTGEQAEMDREYDEIVGDLSTQATMLRQNVEFNTFILEKQLQQVSRLTENVSGCMVPKVGFGMTNY